MNLDLNIAHSPIHPATASPAPCGPPQAMSVFTLKVTVSRAPVPWARPAKGALSPLAELEEFASESDVFHDVSAAEDEGRQVVVRGERPSVGVHMCARAGAR